MLRYWWTSGLARERAQYRDTSSRSLCQTAHFPGGAVHTHRNPAYG